MDKPINPFDFFRMREQYEIQRAFRMADGGHLALATYEEFLKQEQDELIQKAIRKDVALARDRIAVKKQVKKVLSTRAAINGSKGGKTRSQKTEALKKWVAEQPSRRNESAHAKADRLMRSVPAELTKPIKDPQGVMYREILKESKKVLR